MQNDHHQSKIVTPNIWAARDYSSGDLLQVFWPYLRPHKGRLLAAVLALVLVASALLCMGRGLAYLVDEGLGKGDPDLLDRAVLATALIALVLAFGSFLRTTMVNKIGELVLADIRRALFSHVMELSASWFENNRTGDVLARIKTDTTVVQTVMTSTLSMAARNLLLLIGGVVMVVLSSPKMTLVVMVVVPLVVLPLIILGRRLRVTSRLAQDRLADVAVEAEETINAMYTVQAFGREQQMRAKFDHAIQNSLDASLERVKLRGVLSGILIFLVFSGISVILWIGGQDLMAGRISPGDLSSFIFYAFLVAISTGLLSELAGDLQRAAGAAERIAHLIETQAFMPQPAMPQPLNLYSSVACQFDRVDFAYPCAEGRPAVADLDFTIAAGERVAIVGPSGAGKSTLFHLLLRFHDPISGRILVTDVDLCDLVTAELRGHIGLVPQNAALFSSTGRENIAFGRPDVSHDQIVDAAQKAQADEFISALDGGYDALVGEKGLRLSGGRRQRIAIARAILRNPRLLLLDEATNALDAQSEAAVQNALENLMKNRTSLVIAHRLATVVQADRILLMDRGRIQAIGTHEALMVESALYRTLAELQFSLQKS